MPEESPPPPILIVDDDSVYRLLIKRYLGDKYTFHEATCLAEAQYILADEKLACVLLDYRLPDGTAFGILPLVTSLSIPVVMMTAMGREQLGVDAIEQGCSAYFVKEEMGKEALQGIIDSAIQVL